jgi:ATP-dependent DNA helicase RecG
MIEQQNIEYKSCWRDEYLKWICGFANAQGGKIFIGVDDKGNVIGLDDYIKLMDDIPNKAVSYLGLVVDVNLHKKDGKCYIEIDVPVSTVPISFHGIYHYRSGSTKQELKGIALQNWLLKKMGKHWEDIPVPSATIDDLDEPTIQRFLKKAIEKDRVPADAANNSTAELLEKLNLVTKDGQLTNAALLLFGKRPYSISATTSFKIGRFGKQLHDLHFQDIIETNLFTMADLVMGKLNDRYLIRPISYKGLERLEPLEYPEPALREAVLNAIIHKDYSSTWIFLRVYDDRLEIWNPGTLPEELTVEKLKGAHSSYPRNANIAGVFFKAGYIESWGRGVNNIISACTEAGLPEPVIEEDQGGIRVTFLKEVFNVEELKEYGLEKRQIEALIFIKRNGRITNAIYQEQFQVSKRTASNDLQLLIEKGLINKIGTTGKGTFYVLQRGNNGAIMGQ